MLACMVSAPDNTIGKAEKTMEKEAMLKEVYDKAKSYELRSGNCTQCSIAAIFEVLGVEDEGVFKAATGMADGVGLTGDGQCGALSGGTMAISYFFGRSKEDFGRVGKQMKALTLSKKLHDEFVEEFSTCRCADIQTKQSGRFFNLYDMEEMKAAVKAGMPEHCSTLVGKTARMALKIILEEQAARKAKQVELPVL
jgi:C_GCAxxG_C_C family probable redox protein